MCTMQAYAAFELVLRQDIIDYYSDVNVRNIVDLIQREVATVYC